MNEDTIIILGGGMTGLTVAERLSRVYGDRVVLIEKDPATGGLAASRTENGLSFDLGSHRIHPASLPEAGGYLRELAGGEAFLRRPRRGKMFFRGRYVRYPSAPWDLARILSPSELLDAAAALLASRLKGVPRSAGYREAAIARYGRRMYETFYRDYAEKLWGLPAGEMSASALARKETLALAAGRYSFLYPRDGFGAIPEAIAAQAERNGCRILSGTRVTGIERSGDRAAAVTAAGANGIERRIGAGLVISTLPVDELAALSGEGREAPVLRWRGTCILHLAVDRKTRDAAETYYFPGRDVTFGRVSERAKYSPYLDGRPAGTGLTVEIPCSPGDPLWDSGDDAVLDACLSDLERTGVVAGRPAVSAYALCRLGKVYPVYDRGWEGRLGGLFERVDRISNLFSIGRAGLYLHLNIDHCVVQGLEMASFILDGCPGGKAAWNGRARRYHSFYARR